jgi:hypothetical protein
MFQDFRAALVAEKEPKQNISILITYSKMPVSEQIPAV